MKTQLKKVHVKAQYNSGDDMSYHTTIVKFSGIIINRCGCGGVPKIEQDENGRAMYDYSGELIKIKCSKCSISIPSEKARSYWDKKELNKELIVCVKKAVKVWNGAFCRNEQTEIEFETNR